jgi:3-phosphoshikimate 1-carboxyvinyltransferase
MKKNVRPSPVKGSIQAPPSKSYAQRAIAAAALARGRSEIYFPGRSDDVRAALEVVEQLGAQVEHDGDLLTVQGGLSRPKGPLDCGEAGLSIRMFSSVAAILDSPVTLTGRGSLLKRPMNIVEDSLRAMGVECTSAGGFLPLRVHGPIPGGRVEVDGSFSSQVLTGILIAAPYAAADMNIHVRNLRSRPYIDITLAVMKSFGIEVENRGYSNFFVRSGQEYTASAYRVEGDWSGAAFLLVAGAIAGDVRVGNLDARSPQADRAMLEALERAGAPVIITDNAIAVKKSALMAFEFDATDCPDLFPPLVCLASYCSGVSRIKGAGRLVHKESNRASALMEEFGKMGIRITWRDDLMEIEGGRCTGADVFSHGDHRIAMACAVAALAGEGTVEIHDAGAVAKSYPDFFADLDTLTAE